MALRARKVSGAFEKRAPDLIMICLSRSIAKRVSHFVGRLNHHLKLTAELNDTARQFVKQSFRFVSRLNAACPSCSPVGN